MSKIKKLFIAQLTLLLFLSNFTSCFGAELSVSAQAYLLMDAKTGQILLEKNAFEKRAPASTTKILTAIMALEQGGLERKVKVSPHAASIGESSIYLEPGEEISVLRLVQGALIKSGNDATVALAEYYCGSEELFSVLMNRKAKLLGAFNSNFKNPNGLPLKNHYTTAFDLAQMARYSLKNPIFKEIVSTKEMKIPYENKSWARYLKNTNKLLWKYPGADGIKTGTTREAGCCLVASATRGNRQLIAVVLHSFDRFGEAARLLDYGFENSK
ncbi:D-alanyl-D-alanine carboxypeptidase family protein [Bacillota bacterium LX-D]|nr:D-alanyl-D-alanine carboxypeptidase family protein [Bacillota bacterium LX-D]